MYPFGTSEGNGEHVTYTITASDAATMVGGIKKKNDASTATPCNRTTRERSMIILMLLTVFTGVNNNQDQIWVLIVNRGIYRF